VVCGLYASSVYRLSWFCLDCRQTKAAAKRKPTGKREGNDEDEEDDDDEEEEAKPLKPQNASSKSTSSKSRKKSASAPAKDGPENVSKSANKNSGGSDVDEVHENLQDKYYMHKYTERDLNKGGKGDLDGLLPYTIAQILAIDTKKSTEKGAHSLIEDLDCMSETN
jgi:hypothetical protein